MSVDRHTYIILQWNPERQVAAIGYGSVVGKPFSSEVKAKKFAVQLEERSMRDGKDLTFMVLPLNPIGVGA